MHIELYYHSCLGTLVPLPYTPLTVIPLTVSPFLFLFHLIFTANESCTFIVPLFVPDGIVLLLAVEKKTWRFVLNLKIKVQDTCSVKRSICCVKWSKDSKFQNPLFLPPFWLLLSRFDVSQGERGSHSWYFLSPLHYIHTSEYLHWPIISTV